MPDAIKALALTAVPAFLLVPSSVAQDGGGRGLSKGDDVNKTYPVSDHDTRPYDKHDFNGIWARNPSAQFHQPPCPECRDNTRPSYGYFGDIPPMTALGQKRFEANHPTKGYVAGSKQALENKDIHVGYRRAVQSALSNDPEERCEPLGLTRLVTFSGGNPPMQIVQTGEIIIQRFEWFWDNREIWTDGRALPKVEDYLPRFNGYSVGKWEGDTLVVTTVGLDDRAMGGCVRLSGQRKSGARGTLFAPNAQPAAPGHDAHRSGDLHPALAFQHQGVGPDPERGRVGRGLVGNCGRPLRPGGQQLLPLVRARACRRREESPIRTRQFRRAIEPSANQRSASCVSWIRSAFCFYGALSLVSFLQSIVGAEGRAFESTRSRPTDSTG